MKRAFLVAAAVALVLAPAAPAVTPPAQPGNWTQVGRAVTSAPGKQLHFYRTAQFPHRLGIVVTSSSSRMIRLIWQSYCEFESDDGETLDDHGTVAGVHSVSAYPSTFPAATLCYVWVRAGLPGTAKVSAAVFRS